MAVLRLWNHISFEEEWTNCDTSILDEIAPSWYLRKKVLQNKSSDFLAFTDRLKRRHAIETGIIEKLYDLDKGVTETLIKEGFVFSLLSHGDTNIPKQTLFNHLLDHLNAVDFIFDVVKEDRPLTKGFICELHQLTTRHQDFTEGRDQFGNKIKIPLLKGSFKERENNPTREDGTRVLYCPPEHVVSEMDRLIEIYNILCEKSVNPLIISAWIHHAFTIIHPFQDGNGRVVRLLSSLILIKNNLFPLTVLREDAKLKYIYALEEADKGNPQPLVSYFAEIQKQNIEEALNIRDFKADVLEDAAKMLKQKLISADRSEQLELEKRLDKNRRELFDFCSRTINEFKIKLEQSFDSAVIFSMSIVEPGHGEKSDLKIEKIIDYASKHNYHFNVNMPKGSIQLVLEFKYIKYEIFITIHHYGFEESVISIAAFLENMGGYPFDNSTVVQLEIKPHVVSILDSMHSKERNIKQQLENILTLSIAQIANEI
jgi:Fic family protein